MSKLGISSISLDFEYSEDSADTEGKSFSKICEEMEGTPAFHQNGNDVSMDCRRSTIGEAEEKIAEDAFNHVALAHKKFKEVMRKVGVRVPQTPMGMSTPVRMPDVRMPPPSRSISGIRRTPGATPYARVTSASATATVTSMAAGAPTVTETTLQAAKPAVPANYRSDAAAATAASMAAAASTGTVTTPHAVKPAVPANYRSDAVILSAAEYEKMKEEADKYQQLKMQKSDVRSRLGGLGNSGWGGGTRQDEFRILGQLCYRCGDDHEGRRCTMKYDDLYCDYPPCVQKVGHTAKVCFELMKRCRLSICDDQRGHRKESHFRPENRRAYGTGRGGVAELKKDFEEFSHMLTQQEKDTICKYEDENLRRGGRQRRWDNPNPY